MDKELVVNIDDKTYTLVKTATDIIVYEKKTDEHYSMVINRIGFDNFYETFRVMYNDDRRIVKEILNELGVEIDVEEDKETFLENAVKKAETIAKKLNGKMCLAR